MTTSLHIRNEPAPTLFDADVAELTNRLIAEIAVCMDEDGSAPSEIALMRHDVVQTVCAYVPDTFQRRR
jgi:hypothetical protein